MAKKYTEEEIDDLVFRPTTNKGSRGLSKVNTSEGDNGMSYMR